MTETIHKTLRALISERAAISPDFMRYQSISWAAWDRERSRLDGEIEEQTRQLPGANDALLADARSIWKGESLDVAQWWRSLLDVERLVPRTHGKVKEGLQEVISDAVSYVGTEPLRFMMVGLERYAWSVHLSEVVLMAETAGEGEAAETLRSLPVYALTYDREAHQAQVARERRKSLTDVIFGEG